MAQLRACGVSLLCALVLIQPVLAQDGHRIWGRVHTTSGDVHEGFIRWDRNEGSWVDVLDGSKMVAPENYEAWLKATDRERAVRAIELSGYRITWNEDDPDFPSSVLSGIRFGHLSSLTVTGSDRADLGLRSGQTIEFTRGATDIGTSMRELIVDVPGRDEVELRWRELDRVVFYAPPAGARAAAPRLFGTVADVHGGSHTGYISWDLDEILESDVLDGDDMEDGDDRRIRFADITSIERIDGGARVALKSGASVDLTGSNDVDDGHRGVQISDPALGMIEVEWPEFRTVRFHASDRVTGYDAFDGGQPLRGAVVTQGGEEIAGMIRWNASESASWELLNGVADDIVFTIELRYVARIEREEAFGATVTLRDGRAFTLDESADVDWDNKGVMVADDGANPTRAASWRVIAWEDFREVRFASESAADARSPGS